MKLCKDCWDHLCGDCQESLAKEKPKVDHELDSLKAHAVEVLARQFALSKAWLYGNHVSLEDIEKMFREKSDIRAVYRAEARALLGWEE